MTSSRLCMYSPPRMIGDYKQRIFFSSFAGNPFIMEMRSFLSSVVPVVFPYHRGSVLAKSLGINTPSYRREWTTDFSQDPYKTRSYRAESSPSWDQSGQRSISFPEFFPGEIPACGTPESSKPIFNPLLDGSCLRYILSTDPISRLSHRRSHSRSWILPWVQCIYLQDKS